MEQLELQEAMDYHFPDNGTAKGKSKRDGKTAAKLTAALKEIKRGSRKRNADNISNDSQLSTISSENSNAVAKETTKPAAVVPVASSKPKGSSNAGKGHGKKILPNPLLHFRI